MRASGGVIALLPPPPVYEVAYCYTFYIKVMLRDISKKVEGSEALLRACVFFAFQKII